MRKLLMVLTMLTLALVIGGCGSSSSSSSSSAAPAGQAQSQSSQSSTSPQKKTHLAKTKFVLHAGLAFGAFHRYIYKPFKAGAFRGGLRTSKAAYLKGGLAGLFAYHEVKVALVDAKSSPLLTKLVSPLTALQTKMQALGSGLKRGQADPAAIASTNTLVSSVRGKSAHAGQPVTDQPTPQLGG